MRRYELLFAISNGASCRLIVVFWLFTTAPQTAHKLSRGVEWIIVYNLCIKFPLLDRNDNNFEIYGLSGLCFFPTMKFQHSSCHRLLVSGRVANRRALFYVLHERLCCCSHYFQALRRLRWWITSEIFRSLRTLIMASPHSQTDWFSDVAVCKTERWARKFLIRWISKKSVG